ncbi:MAG: hypothetical protein R3Y07_04465 [Eubacteriales bacterium]
MAYFDSPKNRAIWDKELVGLRQERAVREANGFQPAAEKEKAMEKDLNPYRKQINLEQLEAAMNKEHVPKKRGRPQPTMEGPSKGQPELDNAVRVPRPKRPMGAM